MKIFTHLINRLFQQAIEMGRQPTVIEVFKKTRTRKATKDNPNPIPDERAQEKIVS